MQIFMLLVFQKPQLVFFFFWGWNHNSFSHVYMIFQNYNNATSSLLFFLFLAMIIKVGGPEIIEMTREQTENSEA